MDAPHPYHHGDLKNALLQSAREILKEGGLAALSLREVARRAGVSHAAPYRHFPSHEALLVELAIEGFSELHAEISSAAQQSIIIGDRVVSIGVVYIQFVLRRPELSQLMFGPQLQNRNQYPLLMAAAVSIGAEIGVSLYNSALGLSVWSAIHGLAMLNLEKIIDADLFSPGLNGLSARTETILRNLFMSLQKYELIH